MIPILFYSEATAFNTNGIGRLTDILSCTVTEERNGVYECEFTYPITGIRYDEIKQGRLIVCTHDDKRDLQPFRIYRKSAPINGVVTFNARHISYDLANVILKPFTATSVAAALAGFTTNAMSENRFTFWTDKATEANFKVEYPISVKAILGGMEGSILDIYGGGEYEWDKLTVRLYQDRGVDSGVTIRYGKNMTDIIHEIDTGDMYNAVVPYWRDSSSGTVIYGDIVGGAISTNDTATWTDESRTIMKDENGTAFEFEYGRVLVVPMDLSTAFGEGVTPTKTQLTNKAAQKLANGDQYLPKERIKVDFVQLWQTDEYANVAVLQRLSLCDTVSVYYPALGVNAVKQKVIRVVYNVLLDRYDSMELGAAKTSFASTITGQITEEIIPQTVDVMRAAIDRATELLTGGMGGHVVFDTDADGKPQEIFIMDTEDVNTATTVLRINLNGIGFSRHGINGPYETAWTLDGNFVADFITAGTLNANLLRAGIIKSVSGNSFWDLVSGDVYIEGNLVTKADTMKWQAGDLSTFAYYMVEGLVYRQLENMNYSVLTSTGEVAHSRTWFNLNYPSTNYFEDVIATSGDHAMRIIVLAPGETSIDSLINRTSGNFGDAIHKAFEDFYYDSTTQEIAYDLDLGASTGGISLKAGLMKIGADVIKLQIEATGFTLGCTQAGKLVGTVSDHGLSWCGYNISMQSSSSLRYKKDIKELEADALDPHRLLDLPVRQYEYKKDAKLQYPDMEGRTLPGFIAEEVDTIYPAATIHDPDTGEVESWDERRIIPGMLALIQEQQKTIDELTKRIERLEALIHADS